MNNNETKNLLGVSMDNATVEFKRVGGDLW